MERHHAKKEEAKRPTQKQRVRQTNKSIEAQRFTTVKLPRSSEVNAPSRIHEVDANSGAQGTAAGGFDPIPNDGMFTIPTTSQYWPPPPLEALLQEYNAAARAAGDNSVTELSTEGMDMYDRRADDAAAKAAKLKIVKVAGEVVHPRGKQAKNSKVLFEADE